MALQIAYEKSETGESYPEAYVRITQVIIQNGLGVLVDLDIFKDSNCRHSAKQPVMQGRWAVNPLLGDGDPIAGAYLAMKTQFKDAKDV